MHSYSEKEGGYTEGNYRHRNSSPERQPEFRRQDDGFWTNREGWHDRTNPYSREGRIDDQSSQYHHDNEGRYSEAGSFKPAYEENRYYSDHGGYQERRESSSIFNRLGPQQEEFLERGSADRDAYQERESNYRDFSGVRYSKPSIDLSGAGYSQHGSLSGPRSLYFGDSFQSISHIHRQGQDSMYDLSSKQLADFNDNVDEDFVPHPSWRDDFGNDFDTSQKNVKDEGNIEANEKIIDVPKEPQMSSRALEAAVVPKSDSKVTFTKADGDIIRSAVISDLMALAEENWKDNSKPQLRFLRSGIVKTGLFLIQAEDKTSLDWLLKWKPPKINNCEMQVVRLVDLEGSSRIKFTMIPSAGTLHFDNMMKLLTSQNQNLNISEWKLISKNQSGQRYIFIFGIDENSRKELEKGDWNLFCEVQMLRVHLLSSRKDETQRRARDFRPMRR